MSGERTRNYLLAVYRSAFSVWLVIALPLEANDDEDDVVSL